MPRVTIYTTPTCQYCKMTKQFFLDNSVEYHEIDVSTDLKAADAMIKKSGQMGVPVIIVQKNGGEEIVVGFQKDKLASLLNIQ